MKYSQTEEEVIIESLIQRYNDIPKTCIEVGATDGLWLSNTAHLWKDLGWKAVLIEADDGNFVNLLRNTKDYLCMCYHKRIEPSGPDSIDELVERGGYLFSGGPQSEIGILSIDIDGDDYHIFEGLKMRPWIVLVEFNATIPPKVDIVSPVGSKLGCSAKALGRLASSKDYVVWGISGSNIILVRSDLIGQPNLDILEYNLKAVISYFQDHSLSYLIQDYEGNWAVFREPVFGFRMPMKEQGDQLWVPRM